jgi:hypothetical protein
MKPLVSLLLALTLAACATPEPRTEGQLANELGLDASSIAAQYECRHAISGRNAKSAPWIDSVCVRTKDRIVFGQYDQRSKRYVQTAVVPFTNVHVVKHFTGMAHHVQLETDSSVHSFFVKATAS